MALAIVSLAISAAWALITISAILERTGEPAAPLDDSYIHLQFARAFAELRPFEYTAGSQPAPGATSLLWPLILAPFAAALEGSSLLWVAWLLGFAAFGLLADEVRLLCRGLVAEPLPAFASLLVLSFGGFTWFAASGMEVLPFAWLLVWSARLVAEWIESRNRRSPRRFWWMVGVGALCQWMRPEGVIALLWSAVALLWSPYAGRRRWAALPLVAAALPSLLYVMTTGQAVITTAAAKWLPLNPYYHGAVLFTALGDNAQLLVGTLLDGRIWARVFLPQGGGYIAIAALLSLVPTAVRNGTAARGFLVLCLALAIFLPVSYETFLVNRLRYIWPFIAAWFIGLVALADTLGWALAKLHRRLRRIDVAAVTGCTLLFGMQLPGSVEDVAESADAVFRQQVSLGKWVDDTLPADAVIGLNDAGALAYYGHRQTFDIVGLTTRGEARYWAAGAGSRFEHYEQLGRAHLPSHFIVYPEWFAIPELLGDQLTSRTVHASILGGHTLSAHVARYDALGSAERPDTAPAGAIIDDLDVADLESESAHGYQLFAAAQVDNRVFAHGGQVDAGRARRSVEAFFLELRPGGAVLARVVVEQPVILTLSVDEQPVISKLVDRTEWGVVEFVLPRSLQPGRHPLSLSAADGGEFAALHYWSSAGR